MSKWKTGSELLDIQGINAIELFEHVKNGLQPYSQSGRPLPSPAFSEKQARLHYLKAELKAPRFAWLTMTADERKRLAKHNPVLFFTMKDDSERSRGPYGTITNEINSLEKELTEAQNTYTWANYDLPDNELRGRQVLALLLGAYYNQEHTHNLMAERLNENSGASEGNKSITGTQKGQTDPDALIRSVSVAYLSETEVRIKVGGISTVDCDCETMGFKKTGKTWPILMAILDRSDHQYHIGIYTRYGGPVENRDYNNALGRLRELSKKFVAFLNKTYSWDIPANFNVFENMKGLDRAGTYRPKFKVIDTVTNREITKDQWLRELEALSELKRHEKDPDKEFKLLDKIGNHLEEGKRHNWISAKQAFKYLQRDDEELLP